MAHNGHDHECHCGHDHSEHHHEPLFTNENEEPAVCSFEVPCLQTHPTKGRDVIDSCRAAVRVLCESLAGQDVLIGHIKLFASYGEDSFWLSTTGGEPTVKSSPGWDVQQFDRFGLHFTAIVYGLEQAALEERIARITWTT